MMDSNDTDCFPTDDQVQIIGWISIGCGIISLVSCLLTLFVALLFQKYRSTTQRVILYLTITVMLISIVFILQGVRSRIESVSTRDDYCVTVAFIDQVVSWMELIAIACLTFDLFVKAVFLHFHTERFEIVYLLLIFIFPFSFNWIPFIHHTFGLGGTYCWIIQYNNRNCSDFNNFGLALRFGLLWIPFYLVMTIVVIAYVISLIKARRRIRQYSNLSQSEHTMKELLHSEIRQYQFYPFILSIVFSVALAARIVEATNHHNNLFWLRVLQIIVLAIQGPLITIVFTLDYDTRKQMCNYQSVRSAFFHLFCICKSQRVQEYDAIVCDRNPHDSLIDTQNNSPVGSGSSYTTNVI